MTLFPSSQDRDTELLSAYLDNQLSAAERAKLERRLEADSELRAALDGLRHVKTRLADLPKVKPPRNFTLTPQMVGQKGLTQSRVSSLIPALNWATAIAAVLFAVLIATDLSGGLRPTSAQPAPAPERAVVQEAPVEGQQDVANSAEKSLTSTPEEALSLMAPAVPPSTEPLTGTGGEGGGGGEPAGPVPPSGEPLTGVGGAGGDGNMSGTPEVSAYAADSLTVTPPSDESLRSLATAAEQPAPETPTPTAAPTEAELQTPTPIQTQTQTLIPLRLAQLVATVALIALLTASFLLRRK